jgi:hypothetical protein
MVLSVRSVSKCYELVSWSNDLVVTQSSAGKNVSMEAEDIVEIRHQATTDENIADNAVVTIIFGVCNSVRLS